MRIIGSLKIKLLLVICCVLITACGQMISDDSSIPLPKIENLKSDKQNQKDNIKKNDNKVEDLKQINQSQLKIEEKSDDEIRKLFEEGVKEVVKNMSLEEKIGQMFLVRCPQENGVEIAQKYHLGGYIMFAVDFKDKSKEQVISEISSYQTNAKIPMWIAVDEEGGVVNRISRNPSLRLTPFASPRDLYNNGGFERVKYDTIEKAELLKSLGVNLNLAPVADIPEKETDFIYNRAISNDPKIVEEYVALMVKTMNENKMASALKHFPGYGNNIDTHTDFAYDERSLDSFKSRDFLPFIAGIKNNAGAIMMSHNVIKQVDNQLPASLSSKVHQLLRNDLNFKGVIISDDLDMSAVKELMSDEEIAVQAILAGNDILCTSQISSQIPAVMEAIKSGKIKEEQIDASVLRILEWKHNFILP